MDFRFVYFVAPLICRSACEEALQILLMHHSKLDNRKTRVFLDEVLSPGHADCTVGAEVIICPSFPKFSK